MSEKGFFGSLFDWSFGEFVTTRVIKVLYVTALVLLTIGAVITLIGAAASGEPGAIVAAIIVVPLGYLLSVLVVRVWLELIIVVFRIAENTTTLVEQKRPGQSMPAGFEPAEE